jgi:hypothetical protein
MKKDKVLDFIKRRFKQDCNWIDGNCYWFALILKKRFPKSVIYYLPIRGHFIIKYKGKFYDWNGIVEVEEKPIKLSKLKKKDDLWYLHLMRDCFK